MGYVEEEKFEVTEDHLKLLRHMFVGWQDCETGAPEIDPKRPYGNSYVPGDVAEILEWNCMGDEEGELSIEQQREALKLHRETETALQICLLKGKFKTGKYVSPKYSFEWIEDK